MTNDIVQADYNQLETIANKFGQLADNSTALHRRLAQTSQQLKACGWEGAGAVAFLSEMEDEIFPAMQRLSVALEQGQTVTRQASVTIRTAEEEAAALFGTQKDGSAVGLSRKKKNSATETKTKYLVQDGPVPLYMVDLDDPAKFNPKDFAANIETNGRPVIFMAHGIDTNDQKAKAGYVNAQQWFKDTYGHLPENKRPIIIGIDWNAYAMKGIRYDKANESAIRTGQKFGELLEQFNTFHPESSVNMVAHSLGNRMFMEAIATSDVKVNSYFANQGAVDRDEIRKGGLYEDILTNEVGRMGATYTATDIPLLLHKLSPWGEGALGSDNPSKIKGREILPYDMSDLGTDIWNHDDYNDPDVQTHMKSFFGESGEYL